MLTTFTLAALIVVAAINLLLALVMLFVGRSLVPGGVRASEDAPAGVAILADCPFVSVHVAIHDEPASLVIATLDALAKLQYPAFEVIVIDNNTPEPSVWRPVERHVEMLGLRFRFYHFDDVAGAKAGALNLALGLADQRSAYVAVVDADYQVSPDFLSTAVTACRPGIQFVQFPQSYRGAHGAMAVVAELGDYFETYPRAANRAQASLLTGTLSLISIGSLRRVGGWPTRSITEDADLGLALWAVGERGLYIDRQVGHGLLPMDLDGLRTQRRRWVTGNMQTLLAGWKKIVRTHHGGMAVVAQLAAWVGFLGVPLVILVLVALSQLSQPLRDAAPITLWSTAEVIAVATFVIVLGGHALRAVMRKRTASLSVTMALLWTSSLGWLAALGVRPLAFKRTLKQQTARSGSLSLDTIMSSVALAAGLVLLSHHAVISGLVLIVSASGLLTAPFVDGSLRRAAAEAAAL